MITGKHPVRDNERRSEVVTTASVFTTLVS